MNTEEKAKRYDEALEVCKKLYNEAKANEYTSDMEDYESIFPELKESENEVKPNGGIVMEDFNEGNGFYKVNLAYLNKEQVEEIEELVKKWNPELKENEDERIKKALINGFNKLDKSAVWYNGITNGQILDWLEKQGEHADFRNKIQIGDKVTRNKDGVLVNLSQLNRVAKKDEKQGEQKPAYKIKSKFKAGDTIRLKDGDGLEWTVEEVFNNGYYTIVCADRDDFIQLDDNWELVEQKPAWSEDDEKILKAIHNSVDVECLSKNGLDYVVMVDWLKSLKGRVQPKQDLEDRMKLED